METSTINNISEDYDTTSVHQIISNLKYNQWSTQQPVTSQTASHDSDRKSADVFVPASLNWATAGDFLLSCANSRGQLFLYVPNARSLTAQEINEAMLNDRAIKTVVSRLLLAIDKPIVSHL